MKRFVCPVCGYVYDPQLGSPVQKIAPGTEFKDLPQTWTCPHCGVGKEKFREESKQTK